MAEELGRVEKPSVESFGGERKLFIVPLLFWSDNAPAEYSEKFELYWQQVSDHVSRLEESLGKVQRVYHESIFVGGEEGLEILGKLNASSCGIAREKCHNGAQLEETDDRELVEESMDWERCLLLGFMSQKVARMVSESYIEASRKRYEHIAKSIDETLKAGERAILFISERHGLQFPKDAQIFNISPPALDQIHRWLRDRSESKSDQQ
ncbi:MAG: hypothetical protein A2Y72_04300 [Chloroflexi bacterium RBG_13_53_26]|nr:MAG: hypothetical protein A2Y72_04300 [Chloroflexi bacterium RBG_13_53_26]